MMPPPPGMPPPNFSVPPPGFSSSSGPGTPTTNTPPVNSGGMDPNQELWVETKSGEGKVRTCDSHTVW